MYSPKVGVKRSEVELIGKRPKTGPRQSEGNDAGWGTPRKQTHRLGTVHPRISIDREGKKRGQKKKAKLKDESMQNLFISSEPLRE